MAHKTDAEMIQHTRNTARFFVENRQIAWVLLITTVTWGWFGYHSMPQRKDPDIPVRVAVASDDLLAKLDKGTIDFDVLVATPGRLIDLLQS